MSPAKLVQNQSSMLPSGLPVFHVCFVLVNDYVQEDGMVENRAR